MERSRKLGTGTFQWNRGGWFGGQIGATLWLLVLGAGAYSQAKPVGVVLIAAGLVPNLLGIALWRQRHAITPYPAIQALVAACGVAVLLAAWALNTMGFSPASLGLPVWLLLAYPGLMLCFHLRERSARAPGS